MELEEARQEAHLRGSSLRPRAVEDFNHADVADLYYGVLEVTHPAGSMPSQRYNPGQYARWQAEREAIRVEVWEAFESGLLGHPLKVKQVIEQ